MKEILFTIAAKRPINFSYFPIIHRLISTIYERKYAKGILG
jgi:hypothetical protein